MPMQRNPNILTVAETAAYLKLSPITIYRRLKEGTLLAAKVGGQWRFRREDLDALLVPTPLLSSQATDALLHALPLAVDR